MEQGDSYGLGDTPLAQMFAEIREALSREIQVVQEQKNLVSAREYYSRTRRSWCLPSTLSPLRR